MDLDERHRQRHVARPALCSSLTPDPDREWSAGVRTDRIGCEQVLIQAQWALLGAGLLAALSIPLLVGTAQVAVLLASTLLMGIASAYELTARNKYCALLVDDPRTLAPTSPAFRLFSMLGN